MFFTRIGYIILALITLLTSTLGIDNKLVDPVDDFKVTTYIIADRVQNIDDLYKEDFDIITDVILFGCANFTAEGEVVVNEEILMTALNNIRAVSQGKDITITLNLLGPSFVSNNISWEDDMEMQSIEHNKAFKSGVLEKNVADVIYRYNLDGVHFDYEYPITLKNWHYFSKFLVSLDKEMGDKIIGIAVCEWNANMSSRALAAVDYFELMMYDIYDEQGRHSTYETATDLVKEATLRGVPLEKLHFGLPFYARPTDRYAYWYDYRGYHDKLDENGFYYDENVDKYFWFNTPDVIAQKTDFAIENGFGGVMIWHYTCDLPSSHPQSLLKAVGESKAEYYG